MRIVAIDYDGTLADTNGVKAAWIERHLGKRVAPWRCNRSDCVPIIGADNYARMGNAVYGRECTLRTPEVPGALEAVRLLARRAELFVVTARGPERMGFAREWLENSGVIRCFTGMLSSKGTSKSQVCSTLNADALVDDDVRHLSDAGEHPFLKLHLQYGRDEEIQRDSRIVFCQSWDEVLRVLASAHPRSGSRRERPQADTPRENSPPRGPSDILHFSTCVFRSGGV
jgi:hypothetical protein